MSTHRMCFVFCFFFRVPLDSTVARLKFLSMPVLLRETIVNRTYGTHQNLRLYLFFTLTIWSYLLWSPVIAHLRFLCMRVLAHVRLQSMPGFCLSDVFFLLRTAVPVCHVPVPRTTLTWNIFPEGFQR